MTSQRDFFAEMYIAGVLGDAGWAVYFPKRDTGFDFVISRRVGDTTLLRPIQVKGLYPTKEKLDKLIYGYHGRLTALHPDMVLILPYFSALERGVAPTLIAYMPFCKIRPRRRGGFRCVPARFSNGLPVPRRDFRQYFGDEGLQAIASTTWGEEST